MTTLSADEIQRYRRHISLPEFGLAAQSRLKAASVLVVGAGGLGSPAALYLAAAGVGRLGIVDDDRVELSNLQRQVLYGSRDIGQPKIPAAVARLRELNSAIEVEGHTTRLNHENAGNLIATYDVIVDGSDRLRTRQVLNEACVAAARPLVYGALYRFEGHVTVFGYENGPCYHCLYGDAADDSGVPDCGEAGVLGVLPGLIGTIQATETIKILAGLGQVLSGRLLQYDALAMRTREFRIPRNPGCAVCGPSRAHSGEATPASLPMPAATTTATAAKKATSTAAAVQAAPLKVGEIDVHELARRLDKGSELRLLDVREPHELEISALPEATLIPLGQLPTRLDELNAGAEYAVFCKSGARSARAVTLLRERGFTRVYNVAGGIDAWAREIDPSLPRY